MDIEKYSFAFEEDSDPPWAMDRRHVEMLHALAMGVPEGGVVVEIGSHRGASTSAFVEALNAGRDFELHLVEPHPTADLHLVTGMCSKPERIVMHRRMSVDFRLERCDLWFVDGDHGWPAIEDVLNGLCSGARVIAMHDTKSALSGIGGTIGALRAAQALAAHPGRMWHEDAEMRPGEWTHRGFGWSVENHRFGSLRRKHAVGRHILRYADGGPDWCVRCGTFSCNLRIFDGTPTACEPIPRFSRFWHGKPNDPSLAHG